MVTWTRGLSIVRKIVIEDIFLIWRQWDFLVEFDFSFKPTKFEMLVREEGRQERRNKRKTVELCLKFLEQSYFQLIYLYSSKSRTTEVRER